jgi:hypothetical protein
MCTLIGSYESEVKCEPLSAKPLDEAVWQAWVSKGRAHDRQSRDTRVSMAKWVSVTALLAAVGLWSRVTDFDVVVRFIVSVGAIVAMLPAFHARQYIAAATFGAIALLFNPLAPLFTFSGDWQRALVLLSAAPFVASLTRRNPTLIQHN